MELPGIVKDISRDLEDALSSLLRFSTQDSPTFTDNNNNTNENNDNDNNNNDKNNKDKTLNSHKKTEDVLDVKYLAGSRAVLDEISATYNRISEMLIPYGLCDSQALTDSQESTDNSPTSQNNSDISNQIQNSQTESQLLDEQKAEITASWANVTALIQRARHMTSVSLEFVELNDDVIVSLRKELEFCLDTAFEIQELLVISKYSSSPSSSPSQLLHPPNFLSQSNNSTSSNPPPGYSDATLSTILNFLSQLSSASAPASSLSKPDFSQIENVIPTSSSSSSSTLYSKLQLLASHMSPLRVALDLVPAHIASYSARASSYFPASVAILNDELSVLESRWCSIEKEHQRLKAEIGDDRWIPILLDVAFQATQSMAYLESIIFKMKQNLHSSLVNNISTPASSESGNQSNSSPIHKKPVSDQSMNTYLTLSPPPSSPTSSFSPSSVHSSSNSTSSVFSHATSSNISLLQPYEQKKAIMVPRILKLMAILSQALYLNIPSSSSPSESTIRSTYARLQDRWSTLSKSLISTDAKLLAVPIPSPTMPLPPPPFYNLTPPHFNNGISCGDGSSVISKDTPLSSSDILSKSLAKMQIMDQKTRQIISTIPVKLGSRSKPPAIPPKHVNHTNVLSSFDPSSAQGVTVLDQGNDFDMEALSSSHSASHSASRNSISSLATSITLDDSNLLSFSLSPSYIHTQKLKTNIEYQTSHKTKLSTSSTELKRLSLASSSTLASSISNTTAKSSSTTIHNQNSKVSRRSFIPVISPKKRVSSTSSVVNSKLKSVSKTISYNTGTPKNLSPIKSHSVAPLSLSSTSAINKGKKRLSETNFTKLSSKASKEFSTPPAPKYVKNNAMSSPSHLKSLSTIKVRKSSIPVPPIPSPSPARRRVRSTIPKPPNRNSTVFPSKNISSLREPSSASRGSSRTGSSLLDSPMLSSNSPNARSSKRESTNIPFDPKLPHYARPTLRSVARRESVISTPAHHRPMSSFSHASPNVLHHSLPNRVSSESGIPRLSLFPSNNLSSGTNFSPRKSSLSNTVNKPSPNQRPQWK